MHKISDDSLKQIASAWYGDPSLRYHDGTAEDLFQILARQGLLTAPGGAGLVVIAERFPVLADLHKGRRSTLVKILEDRNDETIMVADSILSGAKALFLVRLCSEPAQVRQWLDSQQWPRWKTNIQPIDHEKVMTISSMENFVLRSAELDA